MKDAIGDMVLDRRDDCTCPFEAPGEAPPMTDPKSTCFDDCLRAFLTSQYGQGELNPTVCQAISDSGGGGAAFYPLYYLDHKWCGLHWNNPADLRQDPGVDKIINSCQSLGFHNFADPGWPPESYQCNVCSSSTQKQANQPQDAGFSASSTTVSEEPTSTIETPTASTLEPRQEKMHQKAPSLPPEPSSPPYTRLKSPPPVSFTFPPSGLDSTVHPVPSYPKGRESSLRNEITSMTSTASSDYNTHGRHPNSTGTATTSVADAADNPSTAISTNPFAPTPPSSPTRPRRPHERPLEIPDLVSPLSSCSSTLRSPSPGPPPSKALPPPPLALRGSSPVSSAIGIATTTGSARAGHASSSPQGQPDYHRHHHPHHHRYHAASAGGGRGRGGSRDSWGSWEDLTPTSLIGRAISPPAGRFGNEGGTVYPYPDN
ncbi:hypothetical protein Daus18300_007299 [Diaporthe australafricana]|uniref:Uncharacterized protein n=1 Tax=Diaporthe australafricana TaxID=127596 RepID=A0ABR3WND4_9PEZI